MEHAKKSLKDLILSSSNIKCEESAMPDMFPIFNSEDEIHCIKYIVGIKFK